MLSNGAINPNVFSTLAKKWYDGFDNSNNNQTIVLNNNNYSQDDRTRLLNALEVSQLQLPCENNTTSSENESTNSQQNTQQDNHILSVPNSSEFASVPTFRVFDEAVDTTHNTHITQTVKTTVETTSTSTSSDTSSATTSSLDMSEISSENMPDN